MNLIMVEELMLLARKHGATRVRAGDVEVELGPVVPAPQPGEATKAPALPQTLVPRCPCGHAKYDHRGDVGCIHGCPPSRCIPNPPEVKE